MMVPEWFGWAPWIALAAGALAAGLGVLRSLRWALGLAVAALFLQVAVWAAIFLAAAGATAAQPWDVGLTAGFWLALIVVMPYTTIGAVVGGMLAGLARHLLRTVRK